MLMKSTIIRVGSERGHLSDRVSKKKLSSFPSEKSYGTVKIDIPTSKEKNRTKSPKCVRPAYRSKINLEFGWEYIVENGLDKIRCKLEAQQRAAEQHIAHTRERHTDPLESSSALKPLVTLPVKIIAPCVVLPVDNSATDSVSPPKNNEANGNSTGSGEVCVSPKSSLSTIDVHLDDMDTCSLTEKMFRPDKILTTDEFATLYTHVYRMCTQRQPNKMCSSMYKLLVKAIETFIRNFVLSALTECILEDGDVLMILIQRWEMFLSYMIAVNRVFAYLNNNFCVLNDKPRTCMVARRKFRKIVLKNELVHERIIQSIINKVSEIR
eukprot:100443_1